MGILYSILQAVQTVAIVFTGRQAAGEAIRPAYSVMSHPEASFNKGIKRNARIAKGSESVLPPAHVPAYMLLIWLICFAELMCVAMLYCMAMLHSQPCHQQFEAKTHA